LEGSTACDSTSRPRRRTPPGPTCSPWREADDVEVFESGWTFDHCYPIFSDPGLEGRMTLAALAQAT